MTALQLKQPSLMFKGTVLAAQGRDLFYIYKIAWRYLATFMFMNACRLIVYRDFHNLRSRNVCDVVQCSIHDCTSLLPQIRRIFRRRGCGDLYKMLKGMPKIDLFANPLATCSSLQFAGMNALRTYSIFF